MNTAFKTKLVKNPDRGFLLLHHFEGKVIKAGYDLIPAKFVLYYEKQGLPTLYLEADSVEALRNKLADLDLQQFQLVEDQKVYNILAKASGILTRVDNFYLSWKLNH